MLRIFCKLVLVVMFLVSLSPRLQAQELTNTKKILGQKYNLVPPHSRDTQYYEMESRLQKHAPDGTLQATDVYRLYLRCVPSQKTSGKDEYTCLKFTVGVNNAAEVVLPSLTNWKYFFLLEADTANKKEQLFGIDHAKFDKLEDENGKYLELENTFHVYNAFIDFHSMSVFAENAAKDSGIQALANIGDKIVHSASFSEPHEGLGGQISEDSYFKNGKITLHFKGLALVNKRNCAIVEYDSGQSSFYMLLKPMANMEVTSEGSSHYFGDIYKDLGSGWIQKADLHEWVISESVVKGTNSRMNSVIERTIIIKNVARINF